MVFATPGMLHAGQSLQIFKKWAGNEKNMVSSAEQPDGRRAVRMLPVLLGHHAGLLRPRNHRTQDPERPEEAGDGGKSHGKKVPAEGPCSRTPAHSHGLLQLDVKLQVEYMSFSAHADAKGIMQLIRMAEPRSVLLVHGEAAKMEFLKGKIEQEFSEWAAPSVPLQILV